MSLPWRDALWLHFGPGILGGITFSQWFTLLRDNEFAVDPSRSLRACSITLFSVVNSLFALHEKQMTSGILDSIEVPPPLFILGHWRSGTTYLHKLLSLDTRYAYPTLYQVAYPHSFLVTQHWLQGLARLLMPRRRTMGDMAQTSDMPYEEELAVCILTLLSGSLCDVFPRRRFYYERFYYFDDISQEQLNIWKQGLLQFAKKLTLKYKRPLLLKSPPNTGRVQLLSTMFPNAKFVHICRNPYAIFRSTKHTIEASIKWHSLQRVRHCDIDEWIISRFVKMYENYFNERECLSDGQLFEMRYEDLVEDPVREIGRAYDSLGLPSFECVAAAIASHVETVGIHRPGRYSAIGEALRGRLAEEWAPAFNEWKYVF